MNGSTLPIRGLRAIWAPGAVFLVHVLCVVALDLYNKWPPLDIPMHTLGGIAISYFLLRLVQSWPGTGLLGSPSRAGKYIMALGWSYSAGMLWELTEFISDRWLGTSVQGGLPDSMLDMALGALGATATLAAFFLTERRAE